MLSFPSRRPPPLHASPSLNGRLSVARFGCAVVPTGVDGAYFGTTFPHLFFMTYRNMIPEPPDQRFVPRVFGFRVHSSAANGAFARGQGQQHEQHLQERRRLRGPAASASAVVAVAAAAGSGSGQRPARTAGATGSASIGLLEGVAGEGSTPGRVAPVAGAVEEEEEAAGGGEGAGEGRGEVVLAVPAKAKEEWREGNGNGGGGRVLAGGAAAAGGRDDTRRDKAREKDRRGAGACRRVAAENGGQARCVRYRWCGCVCAALYVCCCSFCRRGSFPAHDRSSARCLFFFFFAAGSLSRPTTVVAHCCSSIRCRLAIIIKVSSAMTCDDL